MSRFQENLPFQSQGHKLAVRVEVRERDLKTSLGMKYNNTFLRSVDPEDMLAKPWNIGEDSCENI